MARGDVKPRIQRADTSDNGGGSYYSSYDASMAVGANVVERKADLAAHKAKIINGNRLVVCCLLLWFQLLLLLLFRFSCIECNASDQWCGIDGSRFARNQQKQQQ
jgi:hypothetical protein